MSMKIIGECRGVGAFYYFAFRGRQNAPLCVYLLIISIYYFRLMKSDIENYLEDQSVFSQ